MELSEYAFIVEDQNGIGIQVPISLASGIVDTSFGGPTVLRSRSLSQIFPGAGYGIAYLEKDISANQYLSKANPSVAFPDPQIGGVPNSRTVIVALDSIYPFEVQKF